jgi:hypothetical protein
MTLIFGIRTWFVRLSLAIGLIVAVGCNAERPTSNSEPDSARTARPFEGLEKDLKPPVIVKPSAPPATDAVPPAPKRESR